MCGHESFEIINSLLISCGLEGNVTKSQFARVSVQLVVLVLF